jgi:lipoic acid synthetase
METNIGAQRRPAWLKKKISLRECVAMRAALGSLRLSTVCQEAACPNMGECFGRGEATFLILGDVCTRGCAFCAVKKGEPLPLDKEEPLRVAAAVKQLALRHTVITSVTRDDLPDGGASAFTETIEAIRRLTPEVTIEVLIPDFSLNRQALFALWGAKPDIIGHNVETVPRLYPRVRRQADYARSLAVLALIKEFDSQTRTKSGIMMGLGETEQEVEEVFDDLRKVQCDFLSVGQYLSPGRAHEPVHEYLSPEQFSLYKEKALSRGFAYVASGPYVRSSYHAADYLTRQTL